MGFAGDLGTLIIIGKNPDVYGAVVIQNIGYQTAYIDVIDEMPMNLKAGLGCRFAVFSDISITVAIDTNRLITKDELPTLDIGGDLCFWRFLNFRAGIGLRHDAERFSFGFGINLQDVRFSYAYQPFDFLGDTHRITLDIEFKK